jgi:hypothetical protein
MLRRVLLAGALGTLFTTAEPALAQAEPPRGEEETSWYGWQPLIVDVASATEVTVALSLKSADPYAVFGLGSYVLGGPIVHALHDHWTTAAASLGLRLGLPLAAGGVALFVASPSRSRPSCDGCDNGMAGFGGAVAAGVAGVAGAVAASAIDVMVLSREKVERRPSGVSFGISPTRGGAYAAGTVCW